MTKRENVNFIDFHLHGQHDESSESRSIATKSAASKIVHDTIINAP
jgi:hypothetical protein